MLAHLQRVAASFGLPFGQRTMTFNSRFAQELGKWAEEQGRGAQFHRAAFRAYFADGENIGDSEVLAAVARSVGLSDRKARAVIKSRAYKQAVDDDWERSHRSGITAVPTFQLGEDRLVGAQPFAVLEKFLADHGTPRRAARPSA